MFVHCFDRISMSSCSSNKRNCITALSIVYKNASSSKALTPQNSNFKTWQKKIQTNFKNENNLQGVSTTESGIYQCITKAIGGHTLKVKGVELVVKRDWEETFETDPEVSRGLLVGFVSSWQVVPLPDQHVQSSHRRSRPPHFAHGRRILFHSEKTAIKSVSRSKKCSYFFSLWSWREC